jgi:hypothetical protein
MSRARGAAALICAASLALLASSASAQARPPNAPSREFDVGVSWVGRTSYGSADANLSTGSGGTQPLFSTRTEMGAAVAVEARFGVGLTGHLRGEASGTWGRSELRTTVSADFEDAAPATLTLTIANFSAEGAGVWSFRPRRPFEPYVRAGAGWMRELTDGSVLAVDSLVANVGGGVKYWWGRHAGLRSELRAVIRSGGLEAGTATRRISPALTASAAFRF